MSRLLLSRGADPYASAKSITPLSIAAEKNQKDILLLFKSCISEIETKPANENKKNQCQKAPEAITEEKMRLIQPRFDEFGSSLPFPTDKISSGVAFIKSRRQIWVYGGYEMQSGLYTNEMWLYELNSEPPSPNNGCSVDKAGWIKVFDNDSDDQSRPPASVGHSLTCVGDKLFLFGGNNEIQTFKDLWSFDPDSKSWTKEKSGPSSRYFHSAHAALGKLWIVGGEKGESQPDLQLNEVWIFDPAAKQWEHLQNNRQLSMIPRSRHCGAVANRGKQIWIFGGFTTRKTYRQQQLLNDIWVIDTVAKKWLRPTVKGLKPFPLAGSCCCASGNRIAVVGGSSGTDYVNDVFSFDIASFEWMQVTNRYYSHGLEHIPKLCLHSAFKLDQMMVIIGGQEISTRFDEDHQQTVATLSSNNSVLFVTMIGGEAFNQHEKDKASGRQQKQSNSSKIPQEKSNSISSKSRGDKKTSSPTPAALTTRRSPTPKKEANSRPASPYSPPSFFSSSPLSSPSTRPRSASRTSPSKELPWRPASATRSRSPSSSSSSPSSASSSARRITKNEIEDLRFILDEKEIELEGFSAIVEKLAAAETSSSFESVQDRTSLLRSYINKKHLIINEMKRSKTNRDIRLLRLQLEALNLKSLS